MKTQYHMRSIGRGAVIMDKVTNRLGRGYSFDVIRFKLLFAHSHQKKTGTTMRSRLNNMGVPFSAFDEPF